MAIATSFTDRIELDQETRQGLEKLLGRTLEASYSSSTLLREQAKLWRDQYEGVLPSKSQKWSSNVNIPETKEAINTASVNIARAAVGSDPIYEVEALDPEFDDVAQEEENFLQYWNERTRFRGKVAMGIKDALITGQVWMKPGIKATGTSLPPFSGQPVSVDELDVTLTCDYVVTEDMLLCPSNAPSFALANGAFGRKWLRWDEIAANRDAKGFYADAVERVKARWANDQVVSQIHEQQGIDTEEPEEIWQARFQCWEGIYRWRKPGDTRETEWLILCAYDVDEGGDAIILRMAPYKPLFGDKWFFIPIIANPRPNSMWGWSMCEDIRGLQNVTNTLFNGMVDAIQISLLPPIAVPPGSDISRRNLKWGPLEKWPVANPADVKVLEGSASSIAAIGAGLGQLEYIRQAKERVTATTDVSAGRPNNEARTKFEIQAVIASGNQIFEHQVTLIQIGVEEGHGLQAYAEVMMEIMRRFLPNRPVRYKSKSGSREPWQVVDPAWHEGRYEFIPKGNSGNSNPETRVNMAMAMMQTQRESPFTQLSMLDTPESLLEKVQRLYRSQSALLQALGEKHVDSVIGSEPDTVEEALQIAAVLNPQVAEVVAMRYEQEQQGGQGGMVPPGVPPGMAPNTAPPVGGAFGGGGAAVPPGGGEGIPGLNIPSGMVPL